MPEFKKLSKEEIERIKAKIQNRKGPSQRELLRQEYIKYLRQYAPGDWVDVTLTRGEKKQTIKNRLKRAAKELGYDLRFQRTKESIRFEIVKADKAAA